MFYILAATLVIIFGAAILKQNKKIQEQKRLLRKRLLRGQPPKPEVGIEQDDWKQYPASKLKKVDKVSDDVWLYYKNKPGKFSQLLWTVFPVLWTAILLFCFIFGDKEALGDPGLGVYLLLTGLTILFFFLAFKILTKVVIEIDRRQGTLKVRKQFLRFTRREDLSLLSTFNTVLLVLEKFDEHPDSFRIWLTGPTAKNLDWHSDAREWFSADPGTAWILSLDKRNEDTKYEAKRYAAELANFLNFRIADTTVEIDSNGLVR